jgi:ATP-dependent RNA helicase RhlE
VGETSKAANTVSQTLYSCSQDGKRDILVDELNTKTGSILVFVRTQHRADRVSRYLESAGIHANRIHGGRSQGQRTTALREFREGVARVLVATDIAARGIDVADIGHVINFDLPQVPEDYIHRIGRTGRAGATGTATSFVTSEDQDLWKDIAKLLKKTGSPVPTAKVVKPVHSAKDIDPTAKIARPPAYVDPRAKARTERHPRGRGKTPARAPKADPASAAKSKSASTTQSHADTNRSGKNSLFIIR